MAKTTAKLGKRMTVKAGVRRVTPMDRTIGLRLRARRLEQHISQEELGDALGITFQQVQKYEKGVNRVGSGRLVEIAKVLGVDTGYFLGDLGGSGKDRAIASRFAEFMATTDGLKINEAMIRLSDGHRQSIIELAQAMVRAYGD